MKSASLLTLIMTFANGLKFKQLFIIVASLFVLDLLVPDMIPMIDEIILGLLTVLLANIKNESPVKNEGDVIEGEIVKDKEAD